MWGVDGKIAFKKNDVYGNKAYPDLRCTPLRPTSTTLQ